MYFTDFAFAIFLPAVLLLHWLLPTARLKNLLLVVASYTFYGWVHPWFCILLAISTSVDFTSALLMERLPQYRRFFLIMSVVAGVGMLAWFKYFNFFVENFEIAMSNAGLDMDPILVRMFLPVGISFYTFQTMSYVVDVYRGQQKASRDPISFALFVSFFPQLVAGPIERASALLPQLQRERRWDWSMFHGAWPLLVRGYLKKMVVADNVALYADRAFEMQQPSGLFLFACTLAFTLQILADWSGYTDIARGLGRLFGVELSENFKSPYLAITPSDYWRRFHITLYTWLRDYVAIPLGGSRSSSRLRVCFNIFVTMTLSGVWHGAAWNYITWGMFNGVVIAIYFLLGFRAQWRPRHWWGVFLAWLVLFSLTNFSHMIVRSPSLSWLLDTFAHMTPGFNGDSLMASLVVFSATFICSLPMFLFMYLDRWAPQKRWLHALFYAACLLILVLFYEETSRDFFYFQF